VVSQSRLNASTASLTAALGRAFGLAVWQEQDRQHLTMCNEVVVLVLDGWRESVGFQAEIAIAQELDKPITFLRVNDQAEENPGQGRGL